MKNLILKTLAVGALAAATVSASAAVDHLLLSEVGIATSKQGDAYMSSEFVEIFNPLGTGVSLDNYYFSDYNNYKYLPKTPAGINTFSTDQIFKFPTGYTLNSGQLVVVCGGAENFLAEFFPSTADPSVGDLALFNALPGSPLLFEVEETNPAVPNVISLNTYTGDPSATPPVPPEKARNFSFTNSGEYGILFYWDGASDLVQDVDIITWGATASGANKFAPKSPTILGANDTPYKTDAGSHAALAVSATAVIARSSITEVDEVLTDGNGLTGHDESTEKTQDTWQSLALSQATPGKTTLAPVTANQPPVVTMAGQMPQFPAAGETVSVVVGAEDSDGTIAGITVYARTGPGAFTPYVAVANSATTFTATLGTFTDGTTVEYYAVATDNGGATAQLPINAPTGLNSFRVDASPVLPGDLVINEILYDNKSTDKYEYVELHNTKNTAINLSGFRFADNNRSYFVIPNGTTIPAKGFIILTLDDVEFAAAYPNTPPGVQVLDWGTFGLNNGNGEDIALVHPNAFQYMGSTTFLDRVVYLVDEPWPVLNPNSTGRPLELINPFLDNSLPESWGGAVVPSDPLVLPGTPGAPNSILSIALVEVDRDIDFPVANQAFKVSASVTPIGPTTIQQVRVFVSQNGGAFAPQVMTLESGTTYSKTIGGFPDNTVVRYYFEITNTGSETSIYPPSGETSPLIVTIKANPTQVGDVVINELLPNNVGPDGYEYIELYNTTNQDIDLSFFKVMTNQLRPFTIPEGTVIQAKSYVVLTQNDFAFRASYGNLSVPLIAWEDLFNMNNTADKVSLIHPNQYNPSGASTPIEFVDYKTVAPWPDNAVQNPELTGASIELINPTYPDRGTNGDRWKFTTNVVFAGPPSIMGTPGALNSTYSGVADWSVY